MSNQQQLHQYGRPLVRPPARNPVRSCRDCWSVWFTRSLEMYRSRCNLPPFSWWSGTTNWLVGKIRFLRRIRRSRNEHRPAPSAFHPLFSVLFEIINQLAVKIRLPRRIRRSKSTAVFVRRQLFLRQHRAKQITSLSIKPSGLRSW